jgi:hypothetical protein
MIREILPISFLLLGCAGSPEGTRDDEPASPATQPASQICTVSLWRVGDAQLRLDVGSPSAHKDHNVLLGSATNSTTLSLAGRAWTQPSCGVCQLRVFAVDTLFSEVYAVLYESNDVLFIAIVDTARGIHQLHRIYQLDKNRGRGVSETLGGLFLPSTDNDTNVRRLLVSVSYNLRESLVAEIQISRVESGYKVDSNVDFEGLGGQVILEGNGRIDWNEILKTQEGPK